MHVDIPIWLVVVLSIVCVYMLLDKAKGCSLIVLSIVCGYMLIYFITTGK